MERLATPPSSGFQSVSDAEGLDLRGQGKGGAQTEALGSRLRAPVGEALGPIVAGAAYPNPQPVLDPMET